MRVLADVADLGIAWPSGGTVARRALIAARPAVVAAYVKAYTEAVYLLRTDRERSVDVIARYGELADRTLAEQTWAIYRDRYALPPYPDVKALETVVAEELVNTSPRPATCPSTPSTTITSSASSTRAASCRRSRAPRLTRRRRSSPPYCGAATDRRSGWSAACR